jgi:hypothetical protein
MRSARQVDADEFFAFISTAQERAASDRLFGQLDKSGDGLLTRREIAKGMETISETSGIAMKVAGTARPRTCLGDHTVEPLEAHLDGRGR